MLEEGESYSGFERNCAFLHLGGDEPRFANVSGATGLDLLDDGRAIAVCDWDYDGRQDFWVTSRTAPRLRLQHNRSMTSNSFVAVRLKGTTCNRDAIGARVELIVKGTPGRRIRTVRAGEGFLAQSSSWVHFGLANGEEIAGLRIGWPGGAEEEIAGLEAGGFFLVEQGSGTAQQWTPPAMATPLADLPAGEPPAPPSDVARIVMASPLPFPAATYLELDGRRTAIDGGGKPLLVNLWATWCLPCIAELEAWKREKATLDKLGIGVLALSVDSPDDAPAERAAIVRPFLEKRKIPFRAGLADADVFEVLEVAGRAQLDKHEPLPIPSSILLDARGRIAAIYKGPVEVAQLAEDAALPGASDEARHAAAAPFPGRWIDGPWPASPTTMIDKFMSFGKPEAARGYLDRFIATTGAGTPRDLAESYFLVGSELVFQKNFPEALVALRQAVALNPDSPRIRLELATLLFRTERFAEAVPHLRLAVSAEPLGHNTRKMLSLALVQSGDHANAVRHLQYLHSLDAKDAVAKLWYGHALIRVGRAAEAERLLREALHLEPASPLILNELAWLLATHPDPEIRKPAEALELAGQAAQATDRREPRVLDTLAAAQAANGDFEAAAATIDAALALAQAASAPAIRQQLETRRAGYLERKPHRESFAGGR